MGERKIYCFAVNEQITMIFVLMNKGGCGLGMKNIKFPAIARKLGILLKKLFKKIQKT